MRKVNYAAYVKAILPSYRRCRHIDCGYMRNMSFM